jgi:hypothetical protein
MAKPWEAYQQRGPWDDYRAPDAATDVSSPWQAAAIGMGRAFDRQATGLRSAIPQAIRDPIDKLGRALGMAESPSIDPAQMQADTDAYAKLEEKFPKATLAGEVAERFVTPSLSGQVALSLMEPGSWDERAVRGAFTYGAGKAGEKVGGWAADKLGKMAAGKAAGRATQTAQQQTAEEAMRAGYKLPPSQVNPSVLNQLAEGFSGKIKTQQAAAVANEPVSIALAKKAIELPDDVPLTRAAVKQVRQKAGEVYETVKKFGTMQADDAFNNARDGIFAEYRQVAAEFPSQVNKRLEALAEDLSKPQFSSAGIVELVKSLRHSGHQLMRKLDASPEDIALGRAQLKAQEALEDLIESNMKGWGISLDPFRKARTLIAKTHTVERALEESTGKIVASKIGRQYASGKPLTGELATIGKTAEAFPRAVQNVNTSMPMISPLDAVTAIGMGFVHPAAAAGVFARPAVRAGILSGPFQRGLLSNAPSVGERMMALAGRNPDELAQLGGLLGAIGGQRLGR